MQARTVSHTSLSWVRRAHQPGCRSIILMLRLSCYATMVRIYIKSITLILLVTVLLAFTGTSSCRHKAMGSESAPVTINSSGDFLNLIPELGWDDAGIIKRSVLTASSITFNGITLKSEGVEDAQPRWYFGDYEYEARFSNDNYLLWIYAYTDDPSSVELDVRSAYFKALQADKDPNGLRLFDNVSVGTTRTDQIVELPGIGKPSESGENPEGFAAVWKYEGVKKRFHRFRLQFDKAGVLTRYTWISG
jgi:hypothetical protein